MNLTLIGMSGAGKSYIGKKLAERLGLTFLDLDEAMEEEHGKALSDILEALGDERFIAAEAQTAIERTANHSELLISTGGSIIYAPEAMDHLTDISKIIFLDVPYGTIEQRIVGSTDRLGRIVGLAGKTLQELYDSRLPLYKRYAHYTLDPEARGLHGSLEDIVEYVRTQQIDRSGRAATI